MEALHAGRGGRGAVRRFRAGQLARPVAADVGVRLVVAIYVMAAANFIGIGFDTTSTDWAVAVAANKNGLTIAPWSVYLPATLIISLVLGLNLCCDVLLEDPGARGYAPGVERGPRVTDIRVRDLGVDIGGFDVVAGITLELCAGTITTLVGPSGAGKSTIAAAVAGALPATHRLRGSVTRRVPVGYLPQDAALTLNPARRIGTALGELLALHGDPPRRGRRRWIRLRVRELLAQSAFPVESDEHRRYPDQFSGGRGCGWRSPRCWPPDRRPWFSMSPPLVWIPWPEAR
ncbi:MAG: ATP-binding cassette domain-containing protein [Mycobacterium sp.]|nr:ATP-binding cassette domain-containing protein [Mycobacterium sp.]